MTADTGDENASGQVGFWMHSWASLASNGLLAGHTHTWSTLGVKGKVETRGLARCSNRCIPWSPKASLVVVCRTAARVFAAGGIAISGRNARENLEGLLNEQAGIIRAARR
jgi:hypothetical protein